MFHSREFALTNCVLVLSVSVVVPVEINSRHYFQSDLDELEVAVKMDEYRAS